MGLINEDAYPASFTYVCGPLPLVAFTAAVRQHPT